MEEVKDLMMRTMTTMEMIPRKGKERLSMDLGRRKKKRGRGKCVRREHVK